MHALVIALVWCGHSRAADTQPVEPPPAVALGNHRLSLRFGPELVIPDIDRDANWAQATLNAAFAVGYAYRLVPWLELGAQAAFSRSGTRLGPDEIIPALSVRGSLPVSEGTEVGLTGRAGLLEMSLGLIDRQWYGSAFTLAADVRTRISARLALQVSLEATRGGAHGDESTTWKQNPTFSSLGLWLGAVLTP